MNKRQVIILWVIAIALGNIARTQNHKHHIISTLAVAARHTKTRKAR